MPLDFDTGRGTLLSVLPETVLTVWAMLVLLHGAWRHREAGAQRQTGWLSLVGVVVTAAVTVWLWTAELRPMGLPVALGVDAFRWAVTLIVLLGAGFNRSQTLMRVAAVESTTLLGAVLGWVFLHQAPAVWLDAAVAHVGGGFLFPAIHAVLGEILKHHKALVLTNFFVGFGALAVLSLVLRML